MTQPQGVRYGDYFLVGKLAQGGMAEVFLAKSLKGQTDRLFALKRTLSQYAREEEFITMFTDEARIASGLRHPNICQISDHGQLGDQRFIVMEFVHGKDLKVVANRALQRQEPIPFGYLAYILSRIAHALHAAHIHKNEAGESQNIVHRDVSPQNILVSYDGTPKLIDFGIAKAKDRLSKTEAGIVKGKFAYMSPEQAVGKDVDARTDVFALGVVLYELVTGKLPFKGASDFSTLKKIAGADYNKPERSDLPPRLLGIIEGCLTRNPDDRYGSAKILAQELERFVADVGAVSERALSAYMRKLFRDDYSREIERIDQYISLNLAPEVGPIEPEVDATTRRNPNLANDDEVDEATMITSSIDLAAGYAEEVTGLAALLESAPTGPDDVHRVDTRDLSDQAVVLRRKATEAPQARRATTEPGDFSFGATTTEVPMLDLSKGIAEHPVELIGEDNNTPQVPVNQFEPSDEDDPTYVVDENISGSLVMNSAPEDKTMQIDSGLFQVEDDGVPMPPPKRSRSESRKSAVRPAPPRASERPRSRPHSDVAPIPKGSQPKVVTRIRRRKRGMSGLEMTVLFVCALSGAVLVAGGYYLKNNGLPANFESYRSSVELLMGPLPGKRAPAVTKIEEISPEEAKQAETPKPEAIDDKKETTNKPAKPRGKKRRRRR